MFASITVPQKKKDLIRYAAKTISPQMSDQEIDEITADVDNLTPIGQYLANERIEDVLINNTRNVFVYDTVDGEKKVDARFEDKEHLDAFVAKLKLYATNELDKGNIVDVHLPTGGRANIVSSPVGYDISIRNFKKQAFSIIDLINLAELDYQMAARLWVYVDGFSVRPANLLIGGMPASGKTTLLNAMFSFFRPETV